MKYERMKTQIKYLFFIILISGCASNDEIMKLGQHYQKYNDYKSLAKVVAMMPKTITSQEVKKNPWQTHRQRL
ncbi:MAG: hypothetical protein C0412_17000 [Flavobacterium sp.]|nr:hypothetical protein [Flavobacterium sp.]